MSSFEEGKIMKERRYDIDWLRVLAILAIFLFHCTRFFDPLDWHLKNAEQSFIALLFVAFVSSWIMPLFFLLSGVGSWYSLKSRTGGKYLVERVKRLLIPLYIVGMLILLPPQDYFDRITNQGYTGTFWELIPYYFSGLFSIDSQDLHDPSFLLPIPFSGHLWFLQYLFLISLMTLPLLLYLKSEHGQVLIERLAVWCDRWGGIFIFLIPLIIVLISLRSLFEGERTWADFIYYMVFFVIGYLIPADKRFTEGFKRHIWICLVLGIVAFCGAGYIIGVLGYSYPGGESFSWIYILFQIVISTASWCWVVFILSLGARYLNFNNKILAYGNEAVLPFYIFHQTIILLVGWFVIRWSMDILPKYLIISVVSFVLIMALYELFVRRINIVRFFFGMRPKKRLAKEQNPR
jgi:peptidoglycan/LPS O-acetylase OafA/YrhL